MKEAFEKIKERLEDAKMIAFLTLANTGDKTRDTVYDEVMTYLNTPIEIVNQVAEEYGTDINVGSKWIPCSEEMPPLNKRVLLTVYVEGGNFNIEIAEYFGDYDWLFDDEFYSVASVKWEVLAWQPLPAPYKPKRE